MTKPKPRAWMWNEADNVYGLSIDEETQVLHWFVNVGCRCDWDDSEVDQTPAQFLARGVPGQIAEPDADTLAEIRLCVGDLAHIVQGA